ncbi:MAG: glycerate kinase [Acidobacteriaceae bacterium]|nr:glycerate kinase [Acidobacteriaceae bacterium]MBV9296648.1 glycerate kinase [Acidobacteriaceae bacterium]MBV9767759.1 glycerate kinase [Acidobacteriaceae bacterium]
MAIFEAALQAVGAANAVRKHLTINSSHLRVGKLRLAMRDFDRVFLIALGKAAVEMASAVEKIMGAKLTAGIAVTKHGHASSRLRRVQVMEAGHPIPDAAGLAASEAVRELLKQLNARDLLLVAISGGASALLPAPAGSITLEEKQNTTEILLRAGATISQLNAVRKHISALKGGRLAALAYPATVVGLLLSDVIGDAPDVIGSGPTAPDDSTFADALAVLEKFELMNRVPEAVREHLKRGARGEISETPKRRDPLFDNVHNVVIGSNRLALEAAARKARSLGFRTLILSSTIEGEAREIAAVHAAILREVVASSRPIRPPACILSGGESTVTVKGNGKGGRNQEFALAAALGISTLANVLVLSAGTDGSDGPTDAAGAIATGETIARARQAGLDPVEHLRNNDSYPFFDTLGDLIRTGPTGTNVMDIQLLLAR